MVRWRRVAAALCAALVLMGLGLPLVGSSPRPDFRWLYIQQLEGYREERAARIAAEAASQAHETEARRLAEEVEELSSLLEAAETRNAELEQYREAAKLVYTVDDLRSTRDVLIREITTYRQQHAEARADLMDAWNDNTKLADILEKYGTDGVWLNQLAYTTSMEPDFGADDIGLMMPAYEPLNVGDIAYYVYPYDDFWNPEAPENCTWRPASVYVVAHRVVERWTADGGWKYRTQGDANHVEDGCDVPQSAVQWVTPRDAVINGIYN